VILPPPIFLHQPKDYLDPLDWRAVFEREAPLEIDLGCGKGNFLAWAAKSQPEHNFVGVDRQFVRLRKVDKKLQRAGVTNVRLLRIESGYLITKLIPRSTVTAYYVFFPDPWPKRRHANNRLFNPGFVTELHRTLVPNGAVNVATDNTPYFEQIVRLMNASALFQSEPPLAFPEEARTEFEQLFLAKGNPIHRARWQRQ
jgi:tRNA (guanine-N7-)-methyltransferase